MRNASRALLSAVVLMLSASAAPATEDETISRLDAILTKPQLVYLARRRAEVVPPPGDAYYFTFKDVPGYREVTVYYLMRTVEEQQQRVRRLATLPSAVKYVLHTDKPGEIRRHIGGENFVTVMRELLAAKKPGGPPPTLRIQRTLFDIGGADRETFFKNREKYYEFQLGHPLFREWPAAYRTPSGQFTASIEHATITLGDGDDVKVIEGTQYFGYTFPALGDLLSDRQKAQLARHVARSNAADGWAPISLRGVKGLGDVTLTYLSSAGRVLPYPTAMVSKVRLSAEQLKKDPTLLRKHLAREGVEHLTKQIREGKRAGRRFRAVEILRTHFDVVTRTEPGAKAVHDAFKRDVRKYARHGVLVQPGAWPATLRRPDGIFDVEQAAVRVEWVVRKQQ